jgi:hypothetical protein
MTELRDHNAGRPPPAEKTPAEVLVSENPRENAIKALAAMAEVARFELVRENVATQLHLQRLQSVREAVDLFVSKNLLTAEEAKAILASRAGTQEALAALQVVEEKQLPLAA